MKNIPNLITLFRILGSVTLLLVAPFSFLFFLLYGLCCISDILDGWLARKLCCETSKGQTYDSIADLLFFTVLLFVLVRYIKIPWEGFVWIFAIIVIKILSIAIGFIKFHKLAFLHTYSNKIAGIMIAGFPLMYCFFDTTTMIVILCAVSTISAIEECLIISSGETLDRNIHSIFKK